MWYFCLVVFTSGILYLLYRLFRRVKDLESWADALSHGVGWILEEDQYE